jgi:hypothetical protein
LKLRSARADFLPRGPEVGQRQAEPRLDILERTMRARVLAGMLILAASGGCSTMKDALKTTPENIERPAAGTPGTFVREDGLPNLSTTCMATLLDQQDKSTVQLVRTVRSGQGDYRVAAGKYGVGDNELLRVDCATARPVGIVRVQ